MQPGREIAHTSPMEKTKKSFFIQAPDLQMESEREVKCTSEVHALPFSSIFLHLLVFISVQLDLFQKI